MVLGVASPTTALGWLTVGRGISCCSFCVYGNWLYSLISCGCSQLNLLWFYLLLKVTRERLVLSKIGALLPVSNVPRLLLGVLGMLSRGVVGQAGMQHSFMLIHPKVFSIFLFLPLPNDERAFYSESFCWHLVVSYFKIQCCGQRIYFCGLNSSTFLETHCVLLNTMFLAAVKWFFFFGKSWFSQTSHGNNSEQKWEMGVHQNLILILQPRTLSHPTKSWQDS